MNKVLISDSIDGAYHRLKTLPGFPFERLPITEFEQGFHVFRIKGLGQFDPQKV